MYIPIIKFYSLLKSTVNCSTVLHGKQNGQLVEYTSGFHSLFEWVESFSVFV